MDENGIHESFMWENQEWAFINSDYLSGKSNEKSSKKVSNSIAFNNMSPLSPKVDVTQSASRKRVASSENNNYSGDQGNKEGGGGNDDKERVNHGRHLLTERERRKKMKNMFTNLKDLIPHLPPKVDKSTVLDEAVKYIKELENTLNDLQKQKLNRLESIKTITNLDMPEMEIREAVLAPSFPIVFKTWISPNIALNVCGYDAHINICCSAKPDLLTTICSMLEKYKIQVLSAHVSSEQNRSMFMIHACVASGYTCQFPVEEIYKQAAREIIIICG